MHRSTAKAENLNFVMKYTEDAEEERNIKRWPYIHRWLEPVSKPMGPFDNENEDMREHYKIVKSYLPRYVLFAIFENVYFSPHMGIWANLYARQYNTAV